MHNSSSGTPCFVCAECGCYIPHHALSCSKNRNKKLGELSRTSVRENVGWICSICGNSVNPQRVVCPCGGKVGV